MRMLVGLCVLVMMAAGTGRGQGEAPVRVALADRPESVAEADGAHSMGAPHLAVSVVHLISGPSRWLHRGRHLLTESKTESRRLSARATADCSGAWTCVVRPCCVRPFAHGPPSPAGLPHPPGAQGLLHRFPDPRPLGPCYRICASSSVPLDDRRQIAGWPTSPRHRPSHAVPRPPCEHVPCERHGTESHSARAPPGQ